MAERMNTYDLDGVVFDTPKAESKRVLPEMLRGGIVEQIAANVLFPAYDLLPGAKLSVEDKTIKKRQVTADPKILKLMLGDLNAGMQACILTSRKNTDGTVRRLLDDNDLGEIQIIHTGTGRRSKSAIVRHFKDKNPGLQVRHLDDGIGEACRFVSEFGIMPDCFTYFKTWHNVAVASLLRGIVHVADVEELQSARR